MKDFFKKENKFLFSRSSRFLVSIFIKAELEYISVNLDTEVSYLLNIM